jgi:mRNA-degrading endonuclease RelE of RelBE toxin-antitoxin system
MKAEIAISTDFFASFTKLPKHIQDKVRIFFDKFCENPTSPGFNLEKINVVNDKQLHSIRIDDNYRCIVYIEKETVFHLLWIDSHDKAYQRAYNIKEINIQNIPLKGSKFYKNNGIDKNSDAKLFARISGKDLVSLGVPLEHLSLIRNIADINTFQSQPIKSLLPENVYANLEWLAYGYHVEQIKENDKRIRQELLDFINEKVLQPSLNHPNLAGGDKESITDTIRMLNEKKNVKEIIDFVDDALDRKRGKQMYNALHKLGITTLEDIEDEIRKIAYNAI